MNICIQILRLFRLFVCVSRFLKYEYRLRQKWKFNRKYGFTNRYNLEIVMKWLHIYFLNIKEIHISLHLSKALVSVFESHQGCLNLPFFRIISNSVKKAYNFHSGDARTLITKIYLILTIKKDLLHMPPMKKIISF